MYVEHNLVAGCNILASPSVTYLTMFTAPQTKD